MNVYQNILCVTDFSASGNRAIERAAQLAGLYNTRLKLLHVIEHFPQNRSNELIAPEDIDPKTYRKEKALRSLSEVAQQFNCGDAEMHVVTSTHSAGKSIVRFATEKEIDLIIIGSYGYHGLAAILGSTANTVLHSAPCDVLAVRATE